MTTGNAGTMNREAELARATRHAASALGLVLCAACGTLDSLLEVEAPSQVEASGLNDPGKAPLLVNSVTSNYHCALHFYVLGSGLITDELQDAEFSSMVDYDRRSPNPDAGQYGVTTCEVGTLSNSIGMYVPISSARWQADDVATHLEGWTDAQVGTNRAALLALVRAYGGYSLLLLGESFCSMALDAGPELTRAQVFQQAEDRFTKALAAAQTANEPESRNLALVGRARARLNLGKKSDARADAEQVALGYTRLVAYSAAAVRRQNRIFVFNNQAGFVTIEPAFRGLQFQGVPDPRVSVVNAGRAGNNGVTPLWTQNKYTSQSASIRMASATEARLIAAEVTGGQPAVTIINALHTAANLPAFASSDEADIQRQVKEERRRELFLEGQRLGDVLRDNIALPPPPGSPYPAPLGGVYGGQICLPLPNSERLNNPNLH